jgi:hypothetical protein
LVGEICPARKILYKLEKVLIARYDGKHDVWEKCDNTPSPAVMIMILILFM